MTCKGLLWLILGWREGLIKKEQPAPWSEVSGIKLAGSETWCTCYVIWQLARAQQQDDERHGLVLEGLTVPSRKPPILRDYQVANENRLFLKEKKKYSGNREEETTPFTCRHSGKEKQACLWRRFGIFSFNLHVATILLRRKLRHTFMQLVQSYKGG